MNEVWVSIIHIVKLFILRKISFNHGFFITINGIVFETMECYLLMTISFCSGNFSKNFALACTLYWKQWTNNNNGKKISCDRSNYVFKISFHQKMIFHLERLKKILIQNSIYLVCGTMKYMKTQKTHRLEKIDKLTSLYRVLSYRAINKWISFQIKKNNFLGA